MIVGPGVLLVVVVALPQRITAFIPRGNIPSEIVSCRRENESKVVTVCKVHSPQKEVALTSRSLGNEGITATENPSQKELFHQIQLSHESEPLISQIDQLAKPIRAFSISDMWGNKQQQERNIMWARLLLIGAAALDGTNFSLVKLMGEADIPIGLSTSIRFAFAAIATSAWLFAKPKTVVAHQKDGLSPSMGALMSGMECGMWNSIGYLSQAVGLETTLASKSAFFCSLSVVVVPILDSLSGRRLKSQEWIGALLAVAGVAVLELAEAGFGDMFSSWTSGDWITMIQPLAFGMGFWRMERALHKYPNELNRCTAGQLLATFLAASMYGFITDGGSSWDWTQLQTLLLDPRLLLCLFWTGLVSTALSVYMETAALKSLSAAESSLLLSTEPLWGAAWAALILSEHVGVDAVIGGFMILIGCFYSNIGLQGMQSFVQHAFNKSKERIWDQPFVAFNQSRKTANAMDSLVGLSSMLVGAELIGAWNNFCIGTRVAILQLQDFIEEFY